MKKVSFAALVVALTSTTFAATADNVPAHCPKAFQGFFLGGNVGFGTGNVSQTGSVFLRTTRGQITRTIGAKNRLGVRGFDGGLNTGYQHRFCNWLLGLEFVANWTNVKGGSSAVAEFATAHHNVKLRNSLQLRGNFSYVIANLVAPKLIVGWDASKWEQSSRFSTTLTPLAGVPGAVAQVVRVRDSKSKYLNGFLIGAGVDFLATKHFIIGMDATVSLFNKKSFNKAFTTTAAQVRATGIAGGRAHGSSKPQPYTKISLIMKFIY